MRVRRMLFTALLCGGVAQPIGAGGPGEAAGPKLRELGALLAGASRPPRLFVAPTGGVLRSFEIALAAGSSYGVGNGGGTIARAAFGLGGIAEVEFSTSEVANQLSGQTTRLPTRSFKMGLMPEWLGSRWYVPEVALQLCTSGWGDLVQRGGYLTQEVKRADFSGNRLSGAALESRVTTLWLMVGRQGSVAGFTLGFHLADVRTRRGVQWLYNEATSTTTQLDIPELQKNISGPAAGLSLAMNARTHLMVEVGPVPEVRYVMEDRSVTVRRVWRGVGGVRFFLGSWPSWDTGVRYQSNFDGIADARIEMAVNIVLPLSSSP